MGANPRKKKQGPPPDLAQLNSSTKRKAHAAEKQNGNARKRRRSNQREPLVDAHAAGAKQKVKKPLLKNADAQTIPAVGSVLRTSRPVLEPDSDLDDGYVADVPEAAFESEGESLDGVEDELDEADLAGASSGEDSVFDSDQENAPKGMFSEDEDESDAEEKLTAANIEGLSRKLDQDQADADAEAQEELEDDALQTNIAADEGLLGSAQTGGPELAPDLQLLRTRITETIRVLGDFAKLREQGKSRADYTSLLLSDICIYYGYHPYLAEKLFSLFTPLEAFAFFEANETPRPVVLRTNTLRTNRRTLAQALINRGVVLEPVGKWSKVGLQVFESAVPLGATPEYLAGHYILQAASSFLPVMALAPQPHEHILDMAAAPGGKTTYISALMRNTGAVLANDANRQRAKGLIGNIHRLGCKNTYVTNLDAKEFPKTMGGFDRVLLDAPCSGTGVIGKDPSVKTSKTERDFLALPHMQKQLLLAAVDSVNYASKTGGYVVYSTCSVTVEENEGVVQYVLRKRPNVRIVDTGLGSFGSEGFKNYMNKRFDEKMSLTRRYFPHRENVDGFFVCKLKKSGPSPKASAVVNGVGNVEKEVRTADADDVMEDGDVNGRAGVEDVFGGFDSAEDEKYIASGEKKRLKKKGLDPRVADKKRRSKERDSKGE